MLKESLEEFKDALLSINRIDAEKILDRLYSSGETKDIETLVFTTLENIGFDWEQGKASLSQVYMSGIIVEDIINKYIDISKKYEFPNKRIGICVLEDFHSIGKNMVSSLLRTSGCPIIDLGSGVSVEDAYQRSIDENLDILLVSVLMLSSAKKLKKLVDMLKNSGSNLKIIAGGAPFRFSEELKEETGIHVACHTASEIFNALREVI